MSNAPVHSPRPVQQFKESIWPSTTACNVSVGKSSIGLLPFNLTVDRPCLCPEFGSLDRKPWPPRYIHKVFEGRESVARLIWHQRLDRCRVEMVSAPSHSMTLIELAYEFGFSSSAYFSRIFRHRFGLTPSVIRAAPRGRTGDFSPAEPGERSNRSDNAATSLCDK